MIFYGDSVVGKIRKVNEDSCMVKPLGEDCILAVVADGMGGHRGGRMASAIALDCICKYVESEYPGLKKKNKTKIRNLLESAAQKANSEIISAAEHDESLRGMGTTVVVCLALSDAYYVISVGDSRMYLCSDILRQITKDHSYVRELVELGLITELEARNHPNKNIITRALGVEKDIEFDFFTGDFKKGDTIFLCSDGLSNMIDDDVIYNILTDEHTPENKTRLMIDMANENGGTDNISVVIVENDGKGGVAQ